MTILEAIAARHSVRKYSDQALEPEKIAALLAPTAINQQKFKFILHPDGSVEARALFSLAGYTHIDLGIVTYHFEVAAGAANFRWRSA